MIKIDTNVEEGHYELIVGGEVDASSSIYLDNAISEALSAHKKVVVDFTGLEYISSAGLGVFMSYIQQMESEGIQLAIFGLQEKVFQVFEILGLDQLITIVSTKEEALKVVNDA